MQQRGRERLLDLVFLVGVVAKGVDGVVELVAGAALLFVTPAGLAAEARALTAHELAEDPRSIVANLVLHGAERLDARTSTFLAVYLLLHGVVKVAIVAALLLGSRRVYPWAIAALVAFLGYQAYLLATKPTVLMVLLTIFDALIVVLTWREWRHGRTLHETMRGTMHWLRHPRQIDAPPAQPMV